MSWIRLSSNICFPASNSQLLRGVYSTVELPWNQTVGNTSPLALWSYGMVSLNANDDMVGDLHSYGIDYEVPCEDSSDDAIVVPENQFHLTDEEKAELFSDIDPLTDDGDSGINHFCDARSRVIDSLV